MTYKKVILYPVQRLLRKLIQQGSSACVINVVLVSTSLGSSLATRAEAGASCGSGSDPEREIDKNDIKAPRFSRSLFARLVGQ